VLLPYSPGRFFAVNEVKALLSYLILNYDFKLPGDSMTVPEPIYFMSNRAPNMTAKVLFKRRKVE